jgi:DNA-binding transcriptional MerR regulator
MAEAQLRIGELARRSGVSAELLRAWERRYGLVSPTRTDSGYRLYSAQDEARVAAMKAHLARGLSAAEAAQLAIDGAGPRTPPRDPSDLAAELWSALDAFDDARAQAAFDQLVAAFSVETIARTAVLPYLRVLGERWREADASVAQEHFATGLLRARLLSLARGWDRGIGPRAVLACPPGEQHDIGLVVFGLALRDRGWRITFLGPDTPIRTLAAAAQQLTPQAVVLSALIRDSLAAVSSEIARLAQEVPVHLAGAGADARLAERTGAHLLEGGPIEAAAGLATE